MVYTLLRVVTYKDNSTTNTEFFFIILDAVDKHLILFLTRLSKIIFILIYFSSKCLDTNSSSPESTESSGEEKEQSSLCSGTALNTHKKELTKRKFFCQQYLRL